MKNSITDFSNIGSTCNEPLVGIEGATMTVSVTDAQFSGTYTGDIFTLVEPN